MPSLLVILLSVSLVVVAAGLLLSYKPQVRSQRYVPSRRVGQEIIVDALPPRTRVPEAAQSKQLIVRRSPMDERRYRGASVAVPLVIDHDFEQYRTGKTIPWAQAIIGLLIAFIFAFFIMNVLLPRHSNWNLIMWNANSLPTSQSSSQPGHNSPQFNASRNLIRLSQLDPSQYISQQEFSIWAYSACSTASLTEVLNAYGSHFRIADVLKVEAGIGEITPQLGLLDEAGIQKTAAQLGFKTTWGHNLSLDQIINIANQGRPVIVSFPPDRYAGGHLLVVTGGNSSTVKLADSSLWNRQSLSRSQFLNWWEGFYAIVTPK